MHKAFGRSKQPVPMGLIETVKARAFTVAWGFMSTERCAVLPGTERAQLFARHHLRATSECVS